MYKNGFRLPWFRLIGLLISCLGLCANALWAQRIVVLDPPDFDPTAVCGFDIRNRILLCVEDANDSCIWSVDEGIGHFNDPREMAGNEHADTIFFYFSQNPKSGSIKVKMGTDEAELPLVMIPSAATVKEITWDPPVCQNTDMEFRIPIDEGYETKYAPGELHLRWTLLWEGLDEMDGEPTFVEVKDDADFIWNARIRGADLKDGKVVVRPFTCDGPTGKQYRTAGKSEVLTPFVVTGLYTKGSKRIHRLKKAEQAPEAGDGGETPTDHWEMDGSETEYNKTICRNYGDVWNRLNGQEGYIYLGFAKDEYEKWLQAQTLEKRKMLPEHYYTYTWTFDETEFAFATSKMDALPYDDGFGVNRSRVILEVLEGRNNGAEKTHTVTLTVTCDSCIKRSGDPDAFTYTTNIVFERQDSILDFASFPIEWDAKVADEVCANTKTEIIINMDNDSRHNFSLSNAKGFNFADYKSLNPPEKANWKGLESDFEHGVYTFETARTTDKWNGKTGGVITMIISPGNDCFHNEKSKAYQIFVRNPPLKPELIDPITNTLVKSRYTDERWEQLQEFYPETKEKQDTAERVLVCNSTDWQLPNAGAWINENQQYGLYIKDDSLFDPNPLSNEAFRCLDYDEVFKSRKMAYEFEKRSASNPTAVKKDSSWVRLSVLPDARDYFVSKNVVRVGFYAVNACGIGDTGIFYLRIIDTLKTYDIGDDLHVQGWDTLCEGVEMRLYSRSNMSDYSGYFTPMDMDPTLEYKDDRKKVNTDRVDYKWTLPDTWTFSDPYTDTDKEVYVKVGRTSGPVRLQLVNRCGINKGLDSNVFVYPFVRCQIVGDTTPCRGETVEYKFVKPKFQGLDGDSIHYSVGYPKTWRWVPGSISGMGMEEDTIKMQFYVDDLADGPVNIHGWYWNSDYENPMPHLSPGVDAYGCNFKKVDGKDVPLHLDTLVINVKPYTSKPIVEGAFPGVPPADKDTLCAEKPYTFQVKKGAEVDDSVFFRWIFPDHSWMATSYSKDSDRVDFNTPLYNPANSIYAPTHDKTIRVVASRYDCDATNTGDTLDIPVYFTDTVSVKGDFYDAHPDNTYSKDNKKRLANPSPCEGDTVYYTLRKTLQDPEAYYATFSLKALDMPEGGVATLADEGDEGDESGETGGDGEGDGDGDGDDDDERVEPDADWLYLAANGWEMLSKAPYHDTVKMVVGRVPMLLRAAMVSHCDTSSFKVDTIWPVNKITEKGQIVVDRPDQTLCTKEAVDFLFDTLRYATHYVFHYPWGGLTDTVKVADSVADRAAGRLTEDGQYRIHFADTFAYNSGVVYLEAYNVCDMRNQVRPDNDELNIVSVLVPPAVPVLKEVDFAPFDYDAAHVIGADTVLDTICLRKAVVLEAAPNDLEAATSAFRYAWELTQPDESFTVFEEYEDADGAKAGDSSLWTLTKEVSEAKINYLYLSSRHKTCQRFGDTLTVALRNIDTTALQGEGRIWNYLYDKESKSDSKRIQTKPCASEGGDVAYYLDLATLDITGESYYFRWRKDSTQAYANVCDADMKLAEGGFILQNPPADADGDGVPDWTTLDTLKMTLPNVPDTLEIQVVVINRCGEEAHMPGLTIQTSSAITAADKYAVVMVSENICDEEKLTFKVVSLIEKDGSTAENPQYDTVDGIDKAGLYIWDAPWRGQTDTTDIFTKSYDTAYKAGSVYVVPSNGCGDGHASEAVAILPNDILQPPLRVQPVPSLDFASGYDPAGGVLIETLTDSLCLRAPFDMAVTAMLAPEVDAPEAADVSPRDELSYAWTTVYGVADSLKINEEDSSKAYVTVPDFADSAYIIYVAARRSVCQRYGDSLRIELFPMDTLRFINDIAEDDQPYDKFVVFTPGVIRDTRSTPVIDTLVTPCVGSSHVYTIIPDFHWSLKPLPAPTFSWNGGNTGADPTTHILDYTVGWVTDNSGLLPKVLSIGKVGEANDVLNLSVHAQNICGTSVSKPIAVQPQALMDMAEQPKFKDLLPLCENETIEVEVEPVANATGYIWKASFKSKPDTTDEPKIRYEDYRYADATVTVYGFNACGNGTRSETLEIQPLLRIPHQPQAKWFTDLKMVGDTVYDTLCLHGNNLLWVEAAFDDEADDDVFYEWQLLDDYVEFANLTALPGQPMTSGPDSIYVTPIDGELQKDDNLYLMVSARRASCTLWGKPLYIALHLTDTVSISDLGRLIWYKVDEPESDRTEEAPKLPLCPGAEVRIGVEYENAAPAYRWQFPDPTWRFADDVTDPTAAVVKVVVGETEGVIRVSPMTDSDNRRCAYAAPDHTLTSSAITLVPALPARVFGTFDETPCAGMEVTYTLQPPATSELGDIARYRWIFPQGWRVYDADGNLTESNMLEPEALTCRVLPDSASGVVRAYVLSHCGDDPNRFSVSKPVEQAVNPQDTARLKIVADASVCKDSTLQMDLVRLNEWTSVTANDVSVTYIGSDATVITNPDEPLVFDFVPREDAGDTLLTVYINWYSGDSTRVTFTPQHTGGCLVLPVTYALKADTIPSISGLITGPERICMGAEAGFEAAATNLEEGVEVTYHWEVPEDEGWEIVSGDGSPVAVIKAGWYDGVDEVEKVIRCYPRALCGTAAPFEYTVKVNPPADFNGTLVANYIGGTTPLEPTDRPCIGSNLGFVLNDLTNHAVPSNDVRYVWETPDGWERLSVRGSIVDSMHLAEFAAAKAGEDTVRVRFLELNNPLSCGLSKPVGYAIAVRDSAPKARLTRPPFPCKTRPEVKFTLVPDAEIEEAAWTYPEAYDPAFATVSTTAGSLIKDNQLTLKELTSGEGFTEVFDLMIRTANVCGSRDTVITVTPVDKIPDLPADMLHVSHYCIEDSGYAYADKLADYVGTGSEYHWWTDALLTPLKDSLVYENDDPAGAETVAWRWFRGAAKATDTAQIRFYIQNDCNATDTVSVRTAPYTYAIWAQPGEDTVVYGQSGVSLSVESTQYGTPADYRYVWQPEDRVSLSDPAAPDAPGTTFATKGLYNPREYFRVIATERIATDRPFYFGRSACEAYDTVEIFVDSTFAMAMAATDTTCMDALFELSANPYGGNSERYYFDWYRLVGDSVYEPIADDGHTATLTLTVDAPKIKLMVIGRDSTLVYADAEIPDQPEEQPEDQPEPEDNPDAPEGPAEPEAPSLGEPLYVFSKVDTQYVEVEAFNVAAHLVQPGRNAIKVPFGTKVKVVVEATAGSDHYAYLWSPEATLDPHDSTMAAVTTRRLYDDCALTAMVRDLVTGCVDTLRVTIGMSDEIGDIPNAFSPNGDGINDIFMKGSDVIIFNRFGQELFRSENQEGWDGTYKGKTVAPGEYLYVVTIRKNGQEYVKKGTVSVFTK